MPSLARSPIFKSLVNHRSELENRTLLSLFDEEPERSREMVREAAGLRFDFSKHRATRRTLELLVALAHERGVPPSIEAMFQGQRINITEHRAVLHVALRNTSTRPIVLDGVDVMPGVRSVLAKMNAFASAVRGGTLQGATGSRFTDVVNIGIGGSDLGPMMVCEALASEWIDGPIRPHFVSNVDPGHLARTLRGLNPATTLFVVASKTFTTQETLANARSARAWLVESMGEDAVSKHFVAVSTNAEEVSRFGIELERMFEFWDWVGGRYSLWSAIGLSIVLAIGPQRFAELLAGAHEMDEHVRTAPMHENVAVLSALLGVWYSNVWHAETWAVLPYSQSLNRLPAWLQQGDMESNGKSVTLEGTPIVEYTTGPIVWGEPGTNGQHAFYQLLHQGTRLVPVDFIVPMKSEWLTSSTPPAETERIRAQHTMLVTNAIAQAEALMVGRPTADSPHRVFGGGRPSTTITMPRVEPRTLGALLAFFEHRIYVQGVIWDVNSFDQWGVELGKELAKRIEAEVSSGAFGPHDPSTTALIELASRAG
jgi:glucose-6-phosphate isomerase